MKFKKEAVKQFDAIVEFEGCSISGPHIFYPGQIVQRIDTMRGRVVDRSSLTATVRWDDGITEEIQQFEETIYVLKERTIQ